jgi:hypothetical protein
VNATQPLPPWEETLAEVAAWDRAYDNHDDDPEPDDTDD